MGSVCPPLKRAQEKNENIRQKTAFPAIKKLSNKQSIKNKSQIFPKKKKIIRDAVKFKLLHADVPIFLFVNK
jgi:hypothetical protein